MPFSSVCSAATSGLLEMQAGQFRDPADRRGIERHNKLSLGLGAARTITAAMPLFNLTDLLAALPPNIRLLGLDPGQRRIGIALSDVTRRLASPYGTLARGRLRLNAGEITAIAAKEGAGGLLIGLPLNDDGRPGPAAQSAKDWAHAISAATGLPAALWDETLSTAETHELLIAANITRARRADLVDRMAAARILQSALDHAARGTNENGGT